MFVKVFGLVTSCRSGNLIIDRSSCLNSLLIEIFRLMGERFSSMAVILKDGVKASLEGYGLCQERTLRFDVTRVKGLVGCPDGGRYQGELQSGLPHGIGECIYPNGDCYIGTWVNGLWHGLGICFYPNGDYYAGKWKEGKKHEEGTHVFLSGDHFEEGWKDGLRHGHGKHVYLDGGHYVGEWRDGLRHGHGKHVYPDGGHYVGEWRDEERHGKGVLVCPDQRRYEGDWFENEIRRGEVSDANRVCYIGAFERRLFHGEGTYFDPMGARYVGEWRECKEHGRGTLINSIGGFDEGQFLDGHFIESGNMLHHLGSSFFLHVLTGESSGLISTYPLLTMFRYLSLTTNPDYKKSAEQLQHAYEDLRSFQKDPERTALELLNRLNQSGSVLLSYGSASHTMGLRIQLIEEDLNRAICEIYNTGGGLNYHASADRKFQTRLQVAIDRKWITSRWLKKLLQYDQRDDVGDAYAIILDLAGSEVLKTPDHEIIWQTAQKGLNCTIEWIFAYLKHMLGPDKYRQLRIQLFKDCIAQIDRRFKEETLPEGESQRLIEMRMELERKIKKREAKASLVVVRK